MNDKETLERILKLIGRDDELLETVATCIEITPEELGDFIDFVEIPELTRSNKQDVKVNA
jgi:hypothetical protein